MFDKAPSIIDTLFVKFFAPLLVYFAPVYLMVTGLVFLLFVDLVVGIWRATSVGEKVTVKRMLDTAVKLTLFNLSLIVAHICESIFTPGIPLLSIVGYFLGLTEVKSIYGNISQITNINLLSYVKQVISNLRADAKSKE